MSDNDRRFGQSGLANAKRVVARLDASRDPEDLAADIIETWSISEGALRSLVGSTELSGQALVKELRQRGLISLGQAHGALELLAARDRAARPGYRPTVGDATAARSGFLELEGAFFGEGSGPGQATVPPRSPGPAVVVPTADVAVDRRRSPLVPAIGLVVALVVVAGGLYAFLANRGPANVNDGIALYQSGNKEEARVRFSQASQRSPESAVPHIFLGRIAREEGDTATAQRELIEAVRLEPRNAQALRELAGFELLRNQLELARSFYVRAVQEAPDDKISQGYLACTLARLGRAQEAQVWAGRAGVGAWSSCLQLATQGVPRTQ